MTANNNENKKIFNKLMKILRDPAYQEIAVLTHTNPDGDTLGAAYALKYAMEGYLNKKNVKVLCSDPVKERLKFICGGEEPAAAADLDFEPQLYIAVDTAEPKLMGDYEYLAAEGKINIKIDHHPATNQYAGLNYTDTEVSSCGEIIYKICKRLGKITKKIGEPIYAAICYDTGSFRHRNTTADTFRAAAELLDAGVDVGGITNNIFGIKTQNELKAIRMALNCLRYYHNDKIAVINISNGMKQNCGITDGDMGDINSIPIDIRGVEVGIIIKQNDSQKNKFRVSMRSGSKIDVSVICANLGGGGHARASGALVEAADPEEAEKIVMGSVLKNIGDI